MLLVARANPLIRGRRHDGSALIGAAVYCHYETMETILDASRRLLVARCPVITLIQPKIPKISETCVDLLPCEIIEFIFDLFDAQSVAPMRLVNSNYLFYAHNKFEKIRQERALKLKTILINHIKCAEKKVLRVPIWMDEQWEKEGKILKLLCSEREKVDALDLLQKGATVV